MRRFGQLRWLTGALGLALALTVVAQQPPDAALQIEPTLFVADIALETPEEFGQLLDRAEGLLLAAIDAPGTDARVSFVLHGPVLNALLRENYPENRNLADRAAILSAMGVIELQACRAWMSGNGLDHAQLLPFVETVDYAPRAIEALVHDEGRIYF